MSKRSAGKLLQIPDTWETIQKVFRGKSYSDRILEQKQNSFNSWADKLPNYRLRGKPQTSKDNVIRVLSFPESLSPRKDKFQMIKEFAFTHNLVTDDGELYYARMAAIEAHAANEDYGNEQLDYLTKEQLHTRKQRQTPITSMMSVHLVLSQVLS